jgi:hypothetical protein
MKQEELLNLMPKLLSVALSAKALSKHVCKIQTLDNEVPKEWNEMLFALAQLDLELLEVA